MHRRGWSPTDSRRPTPENRGPRFWALVDRSGGPDACWPWLGYRKTRGGYGQVRRDHRTYPAHVFAWVLVNGPLPADKPCGLHRCDNPPCCNPTHIFPGTNADNSADMVAKGRSHDGSAVPRGDQHYSRRRPECLACGDRNGSRRHPESMRRGEAHHNAKLDRQAVLEIRARLAGGVSASDLARQYGINRSSISAIKRGLTWAWVEGRQ